jgi:hypothetical protein
VNIRNGGMPSKNKIVDETVRQDLERPEKVEEGKKKLETIEEQIIVENKRCRHGQGKRAFIALLLGCD